MLLKEVGNGEVELVPVGIEPEFAEGGSLESSPFQREGPLVAAELAQSFTKEETGIVQIEQRDAIRFVVACKSIADQTQKKVILSNGIAFQHESRLRQKPRIRIISRNTHRILFLHTIRGLNPLPDEYPFLPGITRFVEKPFSSQIESIAESELSSC